MDMQIEIIGTESLGVRGLCTMVTAADRRILIDPGIALGYRRRGKLPHPFQIYVGVKVRARIIEALETATDVVISHYHGDHIPLLDANPFQLNLRAAVDASRNTRFWCKSPEYPLDRISLRYNDLSRTLGRQLPVVEGTGDDLMTFSTLHPHGEWGNGLGTIMMTRFDDGNDTFVHASDIQLLDDGAVLQILEWAPKTVLLSGPPLYLEHLSAAQEERARRNAGLLAGATAIDTLIMDHHLLRSEVGCHWLDDRASEARCRIICAADFMGRDRLFLESWRDRHYREAPVPEGWHERYTEGTIDIETWNPRHCHKHHFARAENISGATSPAGQSSKVPSTPFPTNDDALSSARERFKAKEPPS